MMRRSTRAYLAAVLVLLAMAAVAGSRGATAASTGGVYPRALLLLTLIFVVYRLATRRRA